MTTAPRWRVIVVDDEPPARDTLRLLLARHPAFALVAECAHGEAALHAVRDHAPDVLLLDVQMPGMDGFEVLDAIGPGTVPAVVFVTAFDRYALRAFETHALDYLLKPFTDERFDDVMSRVSTRLAERSLAETGRRLSALLASRRPRASHGHLLVRDGTRTLLLPHDEILWIEAEDYYVRVHSAKRRTLVRVPLKSLADELDAGRFVRIHRSAIVNLDFVREIEPLISGDQRLVLSDGTELRVSRTYRALLEEKLERR